MFIFNNSGLLVPDKKINCSFQDFEKEFVLNIPTKKRKEIFDFYVKYNNSLKEICNLPELHQWINGSFVTKKQNPGDIDLVTFLDFKLVENLGTKLDHFIFPNSEKIYNVDAYIVVVYPEEHKDKFNYKSDLVYWNDRFSKTRRVRGNKLAKGFIEIKP